MSVHAGFGAASGALATGTQLAYLVKSLCIFACQKMMKAQNCTHPCQAEIVCNRLRATLPYGHSAADPSLWTATRSVTETAEPK